MDVHGATLVVNRITEHLPGVERLDVEVGRLGGAIDAQVSDQAAFDFGVRVESFVLCRAHLLLLERGGKRIVRRKDASAAGLPTPRPREFHGQYLGGQRWTKIWTR